MQKPNTPDLERPVIDEDTDLLPFEEEGPQLPQVITEDFLVQFEKGIDRYKRFLSAIFRLSTPTHWINHARGDEPPKLYLQSPGIEGLMNPLGVSYEKPDIKKEWRKTKDGEEFYVYHVEGIVSSATLGRHGWYVGACTSRDQFFIRRPGWNAEEGEEDILKAALSNWLVNAISRLAGIRSPDPELLKAAGLDLSRIQRIEYGASKTPREEGNKISEAQEKRLWGIARAQKVDSALLHGFLKEKYRLVGDDATARITLKDYNAIVEAVQKGLPEFRAKPAPGNGQGTAPAGAPEPDVPVGRVPGEEG